MLHRMSDEMNSAVRPVSAEKAVHGSARNLAVGLGVTLGGVVIILFGPGISPMLVVVGLVGLIVGTVMLSMGVYQFADNVDRAAKALITGRRD